MGGRGGPFVVPPNSPCSPLQGCLPQTHPVSPFRVISYCNSQGRDKLDTNMVTSHVWLQGCKWLQAMCGYRVVKSYSLIVQTSIKKQNFKIPSTIPTILLSTSPLFLISNFPLLQAGLVIYQNHAVLSCLLTLALRGCMTQCLTYDRQQHNDRLPPLTDSHFDPKMS